MALKEKPTRVLYRKSFWNVVPIMLYHRLFEKIQHKLLTLWLLFVQWRKIPETFEGFAWQLIKLLPSCYNRVDIVADTYQGNSFKSMEWKDRGDTSKILVKSAKSKLPRDFASFLLNNDNKAKTIELIFETTVKEKLKFSIFCEQLKLIYPVTTNVFWSLGLQQQMQMIYVAIKRKPILK